MKFLVTCAFGIEAVLKREIIGLGFKVSRSANGKIYVEGDIKTMIDANLYLRTAERVFIVLGEDKVTTYDDLFDFIKGLDLKSFLSEKGAYHVLAKTVKSGLFSPRDLQSITKKALIENLKIAYQTDTFEETQETYKLLLDLVNDEATLLLDTSGASLHKRGYRIEQGKAPLKETLAAALILLSFYDKTRVLYDPFCGSGTIAIEAALIAKNVAPGLNRKFAFNDFYWVGDQVYKACRSEALKKIDQSCETTVIARDIDLNVLRMAEQNAIEAGVEELITFELTDFNIQSFDEPYGIIITNPPYGERLETVENAELLYKRIGKTMHSLPTYSVYIISSLNGVEFLLGKKADRTRVLFNGNIKSRYYQYYGPRPRY